MKFSVIGYAYEKGDSYFVKESELARIDPRNVIRRPGCSPMVVTNPKVVITVQSEAGGKAFNIDIYNQIRSACTRERISEKLARNVCHRLVMSGVQLSLDLNIVSPNLEVLVQELQ